jgi:hypothetical protein
MDAVLPNVQETKVSLGSAGRPSGQFQSRTRSRNGFEEVVPKRGILFSGMWVWVFQSVGFLDGNTHFLQQETSFSDHFY